MNKNILMVIAGILIFIGIIKPNLSFVPVDKPVAIEVVVEQPSNPELLEASREIVRILQNGDSSRVNDGRRLSALYLDLATLIQLDGEDMVVKNTEEIREANRLSGLMLRMNIKDKYPNLATACSRTLAVVLGDDMVELDSSLRSKAVEAFKALAWAFNEGSK